MLNIKGIRVRMHIQMKHLLPATSLGYGQGGLLLLRYVCNIRVTHTYTHIALLKCGQGGLLLLGYVNNSKVLCTHTRTLCTPVVPAASLGCGRHGGLPDWDLTARTLKLMLTEACGWS